MIARAVAVLALLFACATQLGAQEEAKHEGKGAGETVHLNFAWPDSLDARVVLSRYREMIAERADTTRTIISYRMSVRPHPEGLLVRYSDFDVGNVLSADELTALQEALGGAVPSLVIDRSGQFVRIANVESVVAMVDTILGSLPDPTGRGRAAIDGLLTPETLAALSAQEWNGVVGFWLDGDLEIGALYQLEEEVEIPLLPGSRVPMISDISLTGRVPCFEGAVADGCVEAQVISYPNPEAMAELVEDFFEEFAGETMPPLVIEALDMETEVLLTTDPATLLPHRYQTTKWIAGTGRTPDGSGDFSQLDVKLYEYTYE